MVKGCSVCTLDCLHGATLPAPSIQMPAWYHRSAKTTNTSRNSVWGTCWSEFKFHSLVLYWNHLHNNGWLPLPCISRKWALMYSIYFTLSTERSYRTCALFLCWRVTTAHEQVPSHSANARTQATTTKKIVVQQFWLSTDLKVTSTTMNTGEIKLQMEMQAQLSSRVCVTSRPTQPLVGATMMQMRRKANEKGLTVVHSSYLWANTSVQNAVMLWQQISHSSHKIWRSHRWYSFDYFNPCIPSHL